MRAISWVLIASAALNLLAGWAWLSQRDTVATLRADAKTQQRNLDGARAHAKACSSAVDDLRALADKRQREAKAARVLAQQRARSYNRRADAILAAPPAVPGDDCKSAQMRVADWLNGRTQP